MPTYAYQCRKCSHGADLFLPIRSSTAPRRCPKCRRRTFARLIGRAGALNTNSRVEYPRYDFQFPINGRPGRPNVLSQAHEDRLCKQMGYTLNQGYSRDYAGGVPERTP